MAQIARPKHQRQRRRAGFTTRRSVLPPTGKPDRTHQLFLAPYAYFAVVVSVLAATLGVATPSSAASRQPQPKSTIAVRNPDTDVVLELFETDRFNHAVMCAQGRAFTKDHRERPCRLGHSLAFPVPTSLGDGALTAFVTRSSYSTDGGYGLDEEVVLLNRDGIAVHTLVQWSTDVYDAHSLTLRRRYRFFDVDPGDDLELCIESTSTVGLGRFDVDRVGKYRPLKQSVGYDAFAWDGERFRRAETFDSKCPRRGYTFFVPMPATADLVDQSRNR